MSNRYSYSTVYPPDPRAYEDLVLAIEDENPGFAPNSSGKIRRSIAIDVEAPPLSFSTTLSFTDEYTYDIRVVASSNATLEIHSFCEVISSICTLCVKNKPLVDISALKATLASLSKSYLIDNSPYVKKIVNSISLLIDHLLNEKAGSGNTTCFACSSVVTNSNYCSYCGQLFE